MHSWIWCLLFFFHGAIATPLTTPSLGITYIGKLHTLYPLTLDAQTLPLLTLPYATYRAHSYDADKDIYIFANIRFAAPPVGNLRWAEPADPLPQSGIQDGSIGGNCYQSTPAQVKSPIFWLRIVCDRAASGGFGFSTNRRLSIS
jgi:hypothetical protein